MALSACNSTPDPKSDDVIGIVVQPAVHDVWPVPLEDVIARITIKRSCFAVAGQPVVSFPAIEDVVAAAAPDLVLPPRQDSVSSHHVRQQVVEAVAAD